MVSGKPRIVIVGGYGGMGRLFARIFKKDGFQVVITGPHVEKGRATAKELGVVFEEDNKKAAASADIVIITVPIRKTLDIIREIAPVVKPGALLTDLTSVKKGPCKAMAKFANPAVEIVGMHPVFGPMTDDFKGQNFILCKIRGDEWFSWLSGYLNKKGASITVATPEEHDEIMGVVQGMTHFMLFSAGKTLRDLDFDLGKSKRFASPVYQLILDLVGRILAQDPSMYFEIQLNNKRTDEVRKAFVESCQKINALLKGDEEGFIREINKAADHFEDTEGAMKRTNDLLRKK